MQNPVLAAQVHEIVSRGLDLHERLERGEAADFTTEHDQLRKLLWGEGEAAANPEYAGAIGIGASANCDGQILVMEDMLGLSPKVPKFVKEFGKVGAAIENAIRLYAEDVRERRFPEVGNTYDVQE